nr:uncharacterized protein CTRU02_12646 [Colletotrichum truncatum]KAF6784384.1 hypothetical protein CTRU02_12646 [Colletotrichum truncatum]
MAAAELGLSCPRGGDFYICAGNTTEFFGCCTSNPCANGTGKCPTKDRRISSFNPDRYANIPAQSCDDARPSSEIFYTCKNSISFIGCCASNPCKESDGLCPIDNLLPATLSKDASSRAVFLPNGASSTPSASSTPDSGSSGGGLGTGAIVGIAIGAAVAVAIVIAIIWRCGWHARKRNERREPTWEPTPHSAHPEMGFVAPPHSPSPFDPSQSPAPYDPARASYATTAVPSLYGHASPPHSPYYPAKLAPSPVIDDRHLSTYTDTSVSSLSTHNPRHLSMYSDAGPNLHPVSELDGVGHHPSAPSAPLAELGDGTPANKS